MMLMMIMINNNNKKKNVHTFLITMIYYRQGKSCLSRVVFVWIGRHNLIDAH